MNKNQSKIRQGIDNARTQVRAWFSAWINNPLEYRHQYQGAKPLILVQSDGGAPMSRQDIIARKVLSITAVALIILIMMTVELLIILAVVGK